MTQRPPPTTLGAENSNIHGSTVDGFGDEWQRFDQVNLDTSELLDTVGPNARFAMHSEHRHARDETALTVRR